MTRPHMMASSSMSPLSRTAVPSVKSTADPQDEERRAAETSLGISLGINAGPAGNVVFPPIVEAAKPKKKSEDDEDKEKDDDEDEDKEFKALAVANNDAGDRVHMGIDVARHARECERGRLLAILDSEAGKSAFAANPEKTLRFALTHPGTRFEAIATLELFGGNLQPAKAPPLRERMESVKVEIGQDGVEPASSDPKAMMAQSIIMAGKKRRGEI